MLQNFTFPEMEDDKVETFKKHGALSYYSNNIHHVCSHRFPEHWEVRIDVFNDRFPGQ
jgi:hypothetical protein